MADNLFGHVACGTAVAVAVADRAYAQRTNHLSAPINVAAADTEPIVSATAWMILYLISWQRLIVV